MNTLNPRPRPQRAISHWGLLAVVVIVSACFVSVGSTANVHSPARSFSSTQASQDGIWLPVDETTLSTRAEQASPSSYRILSLNREALSQVLAQAPMEFTDDARVRDVAVSLPMPDGTFGRFRIEESPTMEPELATQFPEVKSYRGQGLDDSTATTRFDWSPLGFHALVLSENGSVYIDPYTVGDTQHYITFFKEDLRNGFDSPQCDVTETMQASSRLRDDISRKLGEDVETEVSVGTSLRTHRLAIATTVEYTNNATYGGGKAATLTKLNTIVNLINAIYEREASIHFNLVSGELSIIFDAEPDGLTNSAVGTMLNESTTVINNAIGSAAYDIGHSFGLAGAGSSSGVAQIGVVCGASKGRGASVLGIALVTGNFSIDSGLVTHEWGHQFSALHTFNSTSNFCNGNRSASAAFEPGSGSTLMAYPGSCSPENLQNNSDNYFQSNSFDSIANYAAGSGACAVATSTGNSPPTISAGADFTIPMGTPFTLTATGSDPNGDPLTFSWEQLDLGAASPPMTDDGTRPLFRSFPAVASPSRNFPKLSDILNNTSTIGESLPTTTRAMNFRVTARDNRAAGGGVNSDAMVLNVSSTAGPFVVTSPNTAVTWTGGTGQTVTWNVAGTSSAPVNCANIKLSLSTDGGNTFPTVLAASTANDGSETITVPNVTTSSARVKVEGVGNVFFDVSNANFTVVPGSSGGGSDTIGLYDPTGSSFFLRNANSSAPADLVFGYGPAGAGWIPVVGDWNGDGIDTIGLYNPTSSFFFLRNANSTAPADLVFSYGPAGAGWIPIAGDWNGDGTDTIGLYNPSTSTFFLRNSNTSGPADLVFSYGPAGAGWIPVVGDWNGDSLDTVGLYNPAASTFFLRNANSSAPADLVFAYGPAGAGWIPVVGDWNGDATDTIGLYNPSTSTFFLRNANSSAPADLTFAYGPAGAGWKPIVGDWDGL